MINKFLKAIDLALFPNYRCMICGRECFDTKVCICERCKNLLVKIDNSVCERCGSPIHNHGKYCMCCKSKPYIFDKSRSCYKYDLYSGKIVGGLKYDNKSYNAKFMAYSMFKVYATELSKADYIIPVPLNKQREKKRGYNQSMLLAVEIAKLGGLEIADDIICRIKNTETQTELSQEQRVKNLIGAFRIFNLNVKRQKYINKNLLIIDDVFTTGSTLNECARQLKKLKPNKIECLTYAKTVIDKNK